MVNIQVLFNTIQSLKREEYSYDTNEPFFISMTIPKTNYSIHSRQININRHSVYNIIKHANIDKVFRIIDGDKEVMPIYNNDNTTITELIPSYVYTDRLTRDVSKVLITKPKLMTFMNDIINILTNSNVILIYEIRFINRTSLQYETNYFDVYKQDNFYRYNDKWTYKNGISRCINNLIAPIQTQEIIETKPIIFKTSKSTKSKPKTKCKNHKSKSKKTINKRAVPNVDSYTENTENIENTDSENTENIENTDSENTENIENTDSENIENIENTDSENTENIENTDSENTDSENTDSENTASDISDYTEASLSFNRNIHFTIESRSNIQQLITAFCKSNVAFNNVMKQHKYLCIVSSCHYDNDTYKTGLHFTAFFVRGDTLHFYITSNRITHITRRIIETLF